MIPESHYPVSSEPTMGYDYVIKDSVCGGHYHLYYPTKEEGDKMTENLDVQDVFYTRIPHLTPVKTFAQVAAESEAFRKAHPVNNKKYIRE